MAVAFSCSIGMGLWAQSSTPAPMVPEVNISQGTSLVKLARTAMATYLAKRTPADKQSIPAELKHLDQWTYAACVTLRNNGQQLARSIKSVPAGDAAGPNKPAPVCRNVIAAALAAMRSPDLPDHITKEYLDGLTIEVEILGPQVPVEGQAGRVVMGADVDRLIVPGLTGLKVSRGTEQATMLPSAGYALGLDAIGVRQAALAQVPQTPANTDLPWRYSLLQSRHFVGYGDSAGKSAGLVVELYRGKILVSPDVVDDLARAARLVAHHLMANQSKEGLYSLGATATPLRDHLYAAQVMVQLGQRLGDKDIARSGLQALTYATNLCQRKNGRAFVATPEPADQFSATAMLALALSTAPRNGQTEKLYGEIVKGLVAFGIDHKGFPLCRLDGQATTVRAPLRDAFLASIVLMGAADTPEEHQRYDAMQKALNEAAPTTAEEALWKRRAGLDVKPKGQTIDPLTGFAQVLPTAGFPDETGGFAAAGKPADTELTALALSVLASGQSWPGVTLAADPAKRAIQLSAATRLAGVFCYTMMFRPHEAYFAEDPQVWVGAVRVNAGSARVTPAACAAAIEVFMQATANTTTVPRQ